MILLPKVQLESHYTDSERQLHEIALFGIATFTEESSFGNGTNNIPLFKSSDLVKMYVEIHRNRSKH